MHARVVLEFGTPWCGSARAAQEPIAPRWTTNRREAPESGRRERGRWAGRPGQLWPLTSAHGRDDAEGAPPEAARYATPWAGAAPAALSASWFVAAQGRRRLGGFKLPSSSDDSPRDRHVPTRGADAAHGAGQYRLTRAMKPGLLQALARRQLQAPGDCGSGRRSLSAQAPGRQAMKVSARRPSPEQRVISAGAGQRAAHSGPGSGRAQRWRSPARFSPRRDLTGRSSWATREHGEGTPHSARHPTFGGAATTRRMARATPERAGAADAPERRPAHRGGN